MDADYQLTMGLHATNRMGFTFIVICSNLNKGKKGNDKNRFPFFIYIVTLLKTYKISH